MSITRTYAYVILNLSKAAFDEIHAKLEAAAYSDQFHDGTDGFVIDMHGIAVRSEEDANGR